MGCFLSRARYLLLWPQRRDESMRRANRRDVEKGLPDQTAEMQSEKKQRAQVYFYTRGQPFFEFTNFSNHPLNFGGTIYATSEAAFQAAKFTGSPKVLRKIQQTKTASDALRLAREFQSQKRADWFDVSIGVMQAVVDVKLAQHPKIAELLLSTGNAELIEDSPTDSFWGCGADKKGRNELGKILMVSRTRLASAKGDAVKAVLDLTNTLRA